MRSRRELLQGLGDTFALMRAAHHSIQSALRLGTEECVQRAAIKQWAFAVQYYTRCLEELLDPPPIATVDATAEAAVERVRSQVLGRITGGRFIRP